MWRTVAVETAAATTRAIRTNSQMERRISLTPRSGERGHRGDHVRTLQARLGALGFDAGPLDGVAGKNTLRAVRSFQRSRGLTQDGICGRRTWDEMWRPDTDETLYQ